MLIGTRSMIAILLSLSLWQVAFAQVGDPTLRTDHPQYAGEGAFQTAADCVRFAEEAAKKKGKQLSHQERALAIYNWLLTHQWHLMSPQEPCVPGRDADTAKGHEDLIVYDAARARFSYGYGLCGTVHAWNEPYWKAAGFNARRRAFPGHTNSEIEYGGSWHAFDTDMAGLLFRKDGVVAGYEDIIADPALATSIKAGVPHYPFAWPSDFEGMKKGWQEVAKNPDKWFRMYNGGYEAMPGIFHLRKGETFTRWFDPDHYGGPTKRRFWHHMKNGPFRDWTFANDGTKSGDPRHDSKEHNARGNASYCNGEFVWEPDLSQLKFDKSPGRVSITFDHWSPYVICGDPEDDANPMTGKATHGLVVEGEFARAKIEVSADQGQTWQEVESKSLPLDLTEYVKGRYGWRVRLTWTGTAEIDSIKFTTTTQVCQSIYPRLKPGGSEVTFRAGDEAVVAVLPNFSLPDAESKRFEDVSRRSSNVVYHGRSPQSRLAYETTNNKPGSVVFPIKSPQPLKKISAAVRYQVRVPPPDQHDYRLEVSTDGGKSWQTFAKAEIPKDNEHSSGWLAGSADVAKANNNEALVRATFYAGGHKTGLMDVQLYGVCRTLERGPIEITYGWREAGKLKTQTEKLTAMSDERRWNIQTGNAIREEFVRIAAP